MSSYNPAAGLAKATVEDRLAIARNYVRTHAVYFSKTLYALTFVPVEGLGTFGTTAELVCGYDPEYVRQKPTEVIAGTIAHEIMHVVSDHFGRLKWCKNKKLANTAADLAINVELRNATHNGKPIWKLDEQFIFPAHFDLPEGKTAEEYYRLLDKQEQAKKKQGGGGDSPEAKGKNEGGSKAGAGACGSVAHGEDHPALADQPGRSEIERAAIVMQTVQAMKEHAAEHGRGSIPGSVIDWLDQVKKKSKRDWRRHLGSVLRDCTGRIQSGGDDFSMRRPSRRSYVRGIYLPGLIENKPVVAFVLDTSGSMGKPQLVASVVEAVAILLALGIDEVWFAEADAGVAMEFKLVNLRFFQDLKIAGRGGTDFRPAFAAAKRLNPPPDLLVYFTDGDGYAPAAPPRAMETVWCVVQSYYNRRPARWGHTVLVSDDPNLTLQPPLEATG